MFFKKKDKKVFTLSEKMEEVFQRNVKPIKDKLGKGFVEFEISFTNSVYDYSHAILNLPENSSYDEEEEALGKMNSEKFSELQQKAVKKVEEQFLDFLNKNELEIVRRYDGKMKLKKYTIPVEEIQNKFKKVFNYFLSLFIILE